MSKICKYEVGSKHWDWTLLDRTVLRSKVLCRCVCGAERMVSAVGLGAGTERNCGCKDAEAPFMPVVILKEPRAPESPKAQQPSKTQGRWYKVPGLRVYNSLRIPPMDVPSKLHDAPERSCKPYDTEDNRYCVWSSMINRCHGRAYSRSQRWYKERGIRVCAEWFDFATFCRDVGPRPDGTKLGRIDHDRGYYPANCRWMTQEEIRLLQRDTFTENESSAKLADPIHKPLARSIRSRVYYVEQEEVT